MPETVPDTLQVDTLTADTLTADTLTAGALTAGALVADVLPVARLAGSRDRCLPVSSPWSALLPEGGLVRGQAVTIAGGAAVSAALALVAVAVQAGSWVALVGVPWVGVEAAHEVGVRLDRTVSVSIDPLTPSVWAERLAASMDGFDAVITQIPGRVPDRLLRRVHQRLRARGAVLVDIRDPTCSAPTCSVSDTVRDTAGADVSVQARTVAWEGLGRGCGYLARRRVEITVTGRRMPRARRVECWLPGPSGGFETIETIEVP